MGGARRNGGLIVAFIDIYIDIFKILKFTAKLLMNINKACQKGLPAAGWRLLNIAKNFPCLTT